MVTSYRLHALIVGGQKDVVDFFRVKSGERRVHHQWAAEEREGVATWKSRAVSASADERSDHRSGHRLDAMGTEPILHERDLPPVVDVEAAPLLGGGAFCS